MPRWCKSQDSPIRCGRRLPEQAWSLGLWRQCRRSQPVRTARGSHPQQPQRQLTGHRDAIREIRKERCGRRFRGGVPFSFRLSQRISFRWFLSHSTGTHLTYTSRPSLPNAPAPALVAPRTLCRDSNSRCPTEARRVLASVI